MQVTTMIVQLMRHHKINDIRQILNIEFDVELKKSIMRELMNRRMTIGYLDPIYDRNAYFVKKETDKEIILTYISGNIGTGIYDYYKNLCHKNGKTLIVDYTLALDFKIEEYNIKDIVINDMILIPSSEQYHSNSGIIYSKNIRRNDILINTNNEYYIFNTQKLFEYDDEVELKDVECGLLAIKDKSMLFNRKVAKDVL